MHEQLFLDKLPLHLTQLHGTHAAAIRGQLARRVSLVVVQITTENFCPRAGNATHTVSLVWSSYSTSASASAVFSTTDHITGFEPR